MYIYFCKSCNFHVTSSVSNSCVYICNTSRFSPPFENFRTQWETGRIPLVSGRFSTLLTKPTLAKAWESHFYRAAIFIAGTSLSSGGERKFCDGNVVSAKGEGLSLRTREENLEGQWSRCLDRRKGEGRVTRLNGGQKDELRERGWRRKDEQPRAVRGRSVDRWYFMASYR